MALSSVNKGWQCVPIHVTDLHTRSGRGSGKQITYCIISILIEAHLRVCTHTVHVYIGTYTVIVSVIWPPLLDLSKPADLGLNHTLHFHLQSTDDVSLGAWHVLPYSQGEPNRMRSETDFISRLKGDQPIIVYLMWKCRHMEAWIIRISEKKNHEYVNIYNLLWLFVKNCDYSQIFLIISQIFAIIMLIIRDNYRKYSW